MSLRDNLLSLMQCLTRLARALLEGSLTSAPKQASSQGIGWE